MTPPRTLLLAVVIWLAGCQDPYETSRPDDAGRPRTSPAAGTASATRRPPPTEDRDAASTIPTDAQITARAAVSAFCRQWANWDWRNIGRQQQRLAWLATGPLARELGAEARLRAQDQVLRRDKLGTRGHVVAIDVTPGARVRDAICVTFEEQIINGHGDAESARHRVYLATLAHTRNGWAISQWQPQP